LAGGERKRIFGKRGSSRLEAGEERKKRAGQENRYKEASDPLGRRWCDRRREERENLEERESVRQILTVYSSLPSGPIKKGGDFISFVLRRRSLRLDFGEVKKLICAGRGEAYVPSSNSAEGNRKPPALFRGKGPISRPTGGERGDNSEREEENCPQLAETGKRWYFPSRKKQQKGEKGKRERPQKGGGITNGLAAEKGDGQFVKISAICPTKGKRYGRSDGRKCRGTPLAGKGEKKAAVDSSEDVPSQIQEPGGEKERPRSRNERVAPKEEGE